MIALADFQITNPAAYISLKPQIEISNYPSIPTENNDIELRHKLNVAIYRNLKRPLDSYNSISEKPESYEERVLSNTEINSMMLMMASYKKEYERAQRKNLLPEETQKTYSHISKYLYKLPFINCAIEINHKGSIKFTLVFENDKVLMFRNKVKESDIEISENEIFYSYFINKNLISSDIANLETFTKNFKGYITA